MKIALAQIEVVPCRPDLNFKKMQLYISKARENGAELIIFPELCIPGYLIGDTWEENAFIKDVLSFNMDVKDLSEDIDIIFGSVGENPNAKHTDGRPVLHNALYYATNKSFLYFSGRPYYTKTLLPNYREFEEPRHFTAALNDIVFANDPSTNSYFTPKEINGVYLGLTNCEDGWDADYPIESPIKSYKRNGCELLINCSCSPFTRGKNNSRNRVFGEGHAKKNSLPLIYVNAVGLQNNCKTLFTFDGSSVAYNKQGKIIAQAPMFEEHLLYVDYTEGDIQPGEMCCQPESDIAEIYQALKYGVHKYLEACGTNRVVMGISGGIDSAVCAALYAQIVGPENLLLVNMPSRYNSKTTIGISETIAKNIGCFYCSIPIEDSVNLTKAQIDGLIVKDSFGFEKILSLSNFHFENVQARDRSSRILSALSCAWGGVFTNNGNKTEMTVGYATLYGDICGFLATIGDLWKYQVYDLAEYINKSYRVLPQEVFKVVASAELSDQQNVDEGKGDPIVYWYHDKLFASWEEYWFRSTPEDNLKWYLNGEINTKLGIKEHDVYKLFPEPVKFIEDLERWYKLFKGMAVAKRTQAPPILAVSRRSYGFDYRETLNGVYFTRAYLEIKEEVLKRNNHE